MILGKIIAGFAADRIGRRAVFAFGALGTAIFLPIIVLFQSPDNILLISLRLNKALGVLSMASGDVANSCSMTQVVGCPQRSDAHSDLPLARQV